jgi:hypothetical protein
MRPTRLVYDGAARIIRGPSPAAIAIIKTRGRAVTPVAAVLFMSGIIALIVGASRTLTALRAGTFERPSLPVVGWAAMSLYGVILASVGIIITR